MLFEYLHFSIILNEWIFTAMNEYLQFFKKYPEHEQIFDNVIELLVEMRTRFDCGY